MKATLGGEGRVGALHEKRGKHTWLLPSSALPPAAISAKLEQLVEASIDAPLPP